MASKGIKTLIETTPKNFVEAQKFSRKLIYEGNKTLKELGFANHTVWDLVETPQPIQSQIISKSQSALRPVLSELGFNAPFGTSQSGRVYERQRRIQYVDKNARTRSRAHSSFPTQFIFSLDGINFQQLSKIDRCVKDCA